MELDLTGMVLPERVEIANPSEDGRSGQFIIEPLETRVRVHPGKSCTSGSPFVPSGSRCVGFPHRWRGA